MRLPTLFLSHGGGPWPFMRDRVDDFAGTFTYLQQLPRRCRSRRPPSCRSAGTGKNVCSRWRRRTHPPMVYDYYGFPEHTYRVKYPAPGSKPLAARVKQLLGGAGIDLDEDAERGFDHGTFVPLAVMYPQAQIPVVSLSLRSNLVRSRAPRDGTRTRAFARRRRAHRRQRTELSQSARAAFGERGPGVGSVRSVAHRSRRRSRSASRARRLSRWDQARSARLAHPREEHLIPLMVVAGAAGDESRQARFPRSGVGRVDGVVSLRLTYRSDISSMQCEPAHTALPTELTRRAFHNFSARENPAPIKRLLQLAQLAHSCPALHKKPQECGEMIEEGMDGGCRAGRRLDRCRASGVDPDDVQQRHDDGSRKCCRLRLQRHYANGGGKPAGVRWRGLGAAKLGAWDGCCSCG